VSTKLPGIFSRPIRLPAGACQWLDWTSRPHSASKERPPTTSATMQNIKGHMPLEEKHDADTNASYRLLSPRGSNTTFAALESPMAVGVNPGARAFDSADNPRESIRGTIGMPTISNVEVRSATTGSGPTPFPMPGPPCTIGFCL